MESKNRFRLSLREQLIEIFGTVIITATVLLFFLKVLFF